MTDYTITETLKYSGYKVVITPLPPHYMDVVEDMYQLMDYPKRMLHLVSGDIVPSDYTPTDECPDKATNPDDHDLWHRWHYVDDYNQKINAARKKARIDLLYSVCVDVIDGKYKVEDEQWVQDLEAAFVEDNKSMNLKHPGYRKLIFIKTQVIRHPTEKDFIVRTAMYEEVTMHGIESAVRGFRPDVGQHTITEPHFQHGKVES